MYSFSSLERLKIALDMLDVPVLLCDMNGIVRHKNNKGRHFIPVPRIGASMRRLGHSILPGHKVIIEDPERAPSVAIVGGQSYSYPIFAFCISVEGQETNIVTVCNFMLNLDGCSGYFTHLPEQSDALAALISHFYERSHLVSPASLLLNPAYRRFRMVYEKTHRILSLIEAYDDESLSLEAVVKVAQTVMDVIVGAGFPCEVVSENNPETIRLFGYKRFFACALSLALSMMPYVEYHRQPIDIVFRMEGDRLFCRAFFFFTESMRPFFLTRAAPRLAQSMLRHFGYENEFVSGAKLESGAVVRIPAENVGRILVPLRSRRWEMTDSERALLGAILQISREA